MNFTGRKARTLLALCSTAAVASGGVLVASPTQAATVGLTLYPTTTNVTTLDLGAGATWTGAVSADTDLMDATYAVKVTSAVTNLAIFLDSAPSGPAGNLYYNQGSVSDPAEHRDAWSTLAIGGTEFAALASDPKSVFLTADVPGTYTLHLADTIGTPGTDDDIVSPTITLNVKTPSTTAGATAWAPVVSAPSSTGIGAPIPAVVPLSGLTLVDGRGSSGGVGELNAKIATLVGLKFTTDSTTGLAADLSAPTNYTVPAKVTNSGARTIPVGVTKHASDAGQPVVSAAVFAATGDTDFTGGSIPLGTSASTVVTSNNVSAVDAAATDVVGSVKMNVGTGAVAVKTGTASVTYTATVTDSDTDKSGNIVYFTLVGTAGTLTTNGTTVDAVAGIYSAVTDATGVATLVVTSSDTTVGTTYTVAVGSNGHDAAPALLTATYANPAAASITITNTEASLYPPVTQTSVTLTGRLYDQFGAVFQPAVSETQQVAVQIPDGNAVGFATITNAAFSYTYTPAITPTVGQTINFRFVYDGTVNSDLGIISWSSSSQAASVTLTTPYANAADVNLSSSGTNGLAPGQAAGAWGNATGEVTGTVKDDSNAVMPYAPVAITGSEGVYFSTTAGGTGADLATSVTVVADASGNFDGAFAFFTKSGTATITATSGTATATQTVTTDVSADPYVVTVNDVTAAPGATVVVTGTIKDAFDNPVPGKKAELSLGTSTLGALGSNTVTTNSSGVFSTTFLAGANQSGTATLTATLYNAVGNAVLTANPTADAAWADTAGMTIADGVYQASSTVTVTPGGAALTLDAPASRVGSGSVTITGTAGANASVQIYAKATRPDAAFGWIKTVSANAEGAYTTTTMISVPTTFVAKTDGTVSSEDTTEMVVLTAPEWSMGGGMVTVSGTALPGTAVTIKKKQQGEADYTMVGTVSASELTGAFSHNLTVTKTTEFLAQTENVASEAVTTKLQSTVTLTLTALGNRQVRLSANGAPDVVGTLAFYEYKAGAWVLIRSLPTNSGGFATHLWTADTVGQKQVRVVYTAPGTYAGAAIGTVVVR
jgi:hypothetical protein